MFLSRPCVPFLLGVLGILAPLTTALPPLYAVAPPLRGASVSRVACVCDTTGSGCPFKGTCNRELCVCLASAARKAGSCCGASEALPEDPAEKAEWLLRGVVGLRVHGTVFSGFVVRQPDGTAWIWTVAHGAIKARTTKDTPAGPGRESVKAESWTPIQVSQEVIADGQPVRRTLWLADVVALDNAEDIALLKLREKHPALGRLVWGLDRPGRLLQPVLALGSPAGLEGTLSPGVISRIGRVLEGQVVDQASCASLGGSSGGPVCCARSGVVLGLIQGGPGESFTCYIPARRFRAWAARHGFLPAFLGVAGAKG